MKRKIVVIVFISVLTTFSATYYPATILAFYSRSTSQKDRERSDGENDTDTTDGMYYTATLPFLSFVPLKKLVSFDWISSPSAFVKTIHLYNAFESKDDSSYVLASLVQQVTRGPPNLS